jgi:hypothetical protein
MSSKPPIVDKEDKDLASAEPGKVLQNPQLPRNQKEAARFPKPPEQGGK